MTFFVFGDSVANGYGLSNTKFSAAARVGYRIGVSPSYHGVNASVVGAQRTEIEAQTITSSDQVIWIAGYNDMRANTAWSSYVTDFEAALDYIVARTSKVYVCGCLRMTATGYTQGSPTWNHGSDAIADSYNTNQSASCASKGVAFVNPNNFYDVNQVQADWVHPSNRGHFQISRAILSIIPSADKSAVGLEYDATLTASGEYNTTDYIKEDVVDASTTTEWCSNSGGTNSWIQFNWASPVMICEIRLRERATDAWGIPRFTFSDSTYSDGYPNVAAGGDVTYALLHPKITTSLKISVATEDGLGTGTNPGMTEVNIKDTYTTLPSTNLTKPDQLTRVSSFAGAWYKWRVIDGVTANEWASNGAGAAAWIQWTFNSPVQIDSIQLRDRAGSTDRWGTPRFTFSDGTTQDGGVAISNTAMTTYTLTPKFTTSIKVSVLSGGTGNNRGLAEAVLTGVADPRAMRSFVVVA